MASGFFDNYPLFYRDQIDIQRRLNIRHHAIIESNPAIIQNKSIVDIACNDGRWSFAALKARAKYVTGIEGRSEFVEMARINFRNLDIPIESFRFVEGDVFDALRWVDPARCDTVFCLGFLYHTLRYDELLTQIKLLKPQYLILDTKVIRSQESIVEVIVEETTPMNTLEDSHFNRQKVAVGWPSVPALKMLLGNYNFVDLHFFPWSEYLADATDVKRVHQLNLYQSGERVTVVCRNADV